MKDAWLMRDGDVLAAADVASTHVDKTKGLLGQASYDRAMILLRTRSIHSVGMKFTMDVAQLDGEYVVRRIVRVPRGRLVLPCRGSRHILEAQAGSFDRWSLAVGDRLEIRDPN